jgi:hypothetical protein
MVPISQIRNEAAELYHSEQGVSGRFPRCRDRLSHELTETLDGRNVGLSREFEKSVD